MLILEIAAGVALAPVVFFIGFSLLWLVITSITLLPLIAIGGLMNSDREAKLGACLFAVTLVTYLAYG